MTKETAFSVPERIVEDWQQLANTLAEICSVPAALIMRLDQDDIEVFVASEGADNPYKPGAREPVWGSGLYCEHVLKTRKKLIVPNALKDDEWKDNPDIPLGLISYMGLPISLPGDKPFGTLCMLDSKENAYSGTYERLVTQLRDLIESHLALLHMNHALGEKDRSLGEFAEEIQHLRTIVPICASCKNIRDDKGYWQRVEDYVARHTKVNLSHGLCPECAKRLYPDFDLDSDSGTP